MPNVKISAAADAGTLLSSDMLPLARSGDTNAYHATMAEVATFASVTSSSAAYNNTGRNQLHNAQFLAQQRGPGPFTAGYTADRWVVVYATDSDSVTVVALGDTDRGQIGNEAARFCLQNVVAGNAAAGAYSLVAQRLEGVHQLSGKTVTVSFWAHTASAPHNVGVSIDQIFGTGGAPSAPVFGTGTAVALTTSWARYSVTLTIPSATGKALGTNGDDCSELNLWFSSGSTNAARSGSVGVQSGTFSIWGVQLEVGSAATPFDMVDYTYETAQVMRFYQLGSNDFQGFANAGVVMQWSYQLCTPMRAAPTVTPTWTTQSNCSGSTATVVNTGFGSTSMVVTTTVTTTGQFVLAGTFTASADL